MIKVLIVDDEQIVREGLSYSLKGFDSIQLVGACRTGREAIEFCERSHPDLIMMDIQMPGIDGLETIKRIKDTHPQIKFIIISAFEQFEYAKEALKIGVKDYISKPISEDRLTEVIDKVSKEILRERNKRKENVEIKEKLDMMAPVLECGFVYSVILNVDQSKQNYAMIDDDFNGYVFVVEFKELSDDILEKPTTYQSMRNSVKYKCDAIVGPLMLNRMVVVVKDQEKGLDYKSRLASLDLVASIYKGLKSLLKCDLTIGVGSHYGIQGLHTSYQEALKALRKISDESILHIEDVITLRRDHITYSLAEVKADEERVKALIEDGQVDLISDEIKGFVSKVLKYYHDQEEIVKSILMEMLVIFNMVVYRNHLEDLRFSQTYLEEAQEQSILNLKNNIVSKGIAITEAIRNEKANKASQVIKDAISYIQDNYMEDLRLKDVAEAVAISPHYFSKIFKDEIGVNFIDYLTEYRLEKSKVLLKEGQMTIKQIAFSVGYKDPNYFSRLFKKIEGVTPKSYQR